MDKFDKCKYKKMSSLPCETVVTMAYVPFQVELVTYKSDDALCNGTLFPELDKNFYGGKCFE